MKQIQHFNYSLNNKQCNPLTTARANKLVRGYLVITRQPL